MLIDESGEFANAVRFVFSDCPQRFEIPCPENPTERLKRCDGEPFRTVCRISDTNTATTAPDTTRMSSVTSRNPPGRTSPEHTSNSRLVDPLIEYFVSPQRISVWIRRDDVEEAGYNLERLQLPIVHQDDPFVLVKFTIAEVL